MTRTASRYEGNTIDDVTETTDFSALREAHARFRRQGAISEAYLEQKASRPINQPEQLYRANQKRIANKASRLQEFYNTVFDEYGRATMSAKNAAKQMGLSESTMYQYSQDLRDLTGDDGLAFSRRALEDIVEPAPARIAPPKERSIRNYMRRARRVAAAAGIALATALSTPAIAEGPDTPQRFPAGGPLAQAPIEYPNIYRDEPIVNPPAYPDFIVPTPEPVQSVQPLTPPPQETFTTWPVVNREPRITSLHGERDLSQEYSHNRWSRKHPGIDMRGRPGDKVIAIASGTVTEARYGKIVVEYDNGWTCDNLHLRADVKSGVRVETGDTIGTLIHPRNYHPHLHMACAREEQEPIEGAIVRHGRAYIDPSCLFEPRLRREALAHIVDGEYRPSGLRFRQGENVQEKLDRTCEPLLKPTQNYAVTE